MFVCVGCYVYTLYNYVCCNRMLFFCDKYSFFANTTFSMNITVNINGRDVQRKNVVNNVDKSSLWAPWQNGPYKNAQYITKHGVYKDATDIKK